MRHDWELGAVSLVVLGSGLLMSLRWSGSRLMEGSILRARRHATDAVRGRLGGHGRVCRPPCRQLLHLEGSTTSRCCGLRTRCVAMTVWWRWAGGIALLRHCQWSPMGAWDGRQFSFCAPWPTPLPSLQRLGLMSLRPRAAGSPEDDQVALPLVTGSLGSGA
jgi:hypothetical protein